MGEPLRALLSRHRNVALEAVPRDGIADGTHLLLVGDKRQFDVLTMLLPWLLRQDVQVVEEGTTACDVARGRTFDAIIVQLPVRLLDGLELCRRLRASEVQTPIMLLGAGGTADVVAALEAGANSYLGAPFAAAEVQARLFALLRRHRPRGQSPS